MCGCLISLFWLILVVVGQFCLIHNTTGKQSAGKSPPRIPLASRDYRCIIEDCFEFFRILVSLHCSLAVIWSSMSLCGYDNNDNNKLCIIIIIPRQCLWCCHHGRAIARVHPVHLMNVEQRQTAADPGSSQTTAGCQSLHPPSPFIIITQPESWYSFYCPMEGRRLSQPSWLVTWHQLSVLEVPLNTQPLFHTLDIPDTSGYHRVNVISLCQSLFSPCRMLADSVLRYLTLQRHFKTAEQWTTWWLVHWPLMGGLLHLVQQGGAWVGFGPAQSPPRCTKCNSPPISS